MIRVFFLMIRRPPRSTLDRSSAASDVYKRQALQVTEEARRGSGGHGVRQVRHPPGREEDVAHSLSLIHISEPTRPY